MAEQKTASGTSDGIAYIIVGIGKRGCHRSIAGPRKRQTLLTETAVEPCDTEIRKKQKQCGKRHKHRHAFEAAEKSESNKNPENMYRYLQIAHTHFFLHPTLKQKPGNAAGNSHG